MKRYFLIAWIAMSLTIFATGSMAVHSQVIDVQLISHSKVGKTASGVVTVTIRNLAKIPVYIPKGQTPVEDLNGRLLGDILNVVDKSGKRARFIGVYNHFVGFDPNEFYTKLEPGESKSRDVDLAKDYDLSSGEEFTVRYAQHYTTVIKMNEGGELVTGSLEQESEVATIWVGRADKSALLTSPAREQFSTASDPDTCTADQRKAISVAIGTSIPLATKAANGIEALHYNVEGKNSAGDTIYTPRLKPDDNYTYWFGAPANSATSEQFQPSVTDLWRTNDDYVMMRTINAIAIRGGDGAFKCGCADGTKPGVAAQTDTEVHTVRICVPTFFNLPANNKQYTSQVLVVIHEYSHFHDDYAEVTGDYAYLMDDSHALTLSNRHNAVRNADNIMYYVGTWNQ